MYEEGIYREVRLDSFEIVTERKLTESEKQMELAFKEDGGDK